MIGAGAACLALASISPGFAQQVTTPAASASTSAFGAWTAGPEASGSNTYVGRLETPRVGQSINEGSNLLVSGWAADTTAQGWAGFDQMQVYNGARATGTKLADGIVGISRPDVADALGSGFATAGFSAVVPASALSAVKTGTGALYIYLHTANKGWWYRTLNVNFAAAPVLAFPSDPIVNFVRPIAGEIITQRQKNNKYSLQGYALDRNTPPPGSGGYSSPCQCGISTLFLYMDKMPGMPGYTPALNDISVANAVPAGTFGPFVNNSAGRGPGVDYGDVGQGNQAYPNFSYVTAQFGPQFNLAGFSYSINPNAYNSKLPSSSSNIAPEMFHTFYAVATSAITGKVGVASTSLYIRKTDASFPASAAVAP